MSSPRPKSPAKFDLNRPLKSIKKYPKNVRWQMEVDYLDRLSPEEKKFLFAFNEAHYGGNARELYDGEQEISEVRHETYAQENDMMNAVDPEVAVENQTEESIGTENKLIQQLDSAALAKIKEGAKRRADERELQERKARAVRRRKRTNAAKASSEGTTDES